MVDGPSKPRGDLGKGAGSRYDAHPGVHRLRTNEITWDEECLLRTCTLLTDL